MSSGSSSSPSSTGSDPTPRRIPPWVWGVASVTIALGLAGASFLLRNASPSGVPLERLAKVPDFRLTAQDGSQVTGAGLEGKIWVANFIFTRCQGPCPLMSSRMAELNKKIGKARDAVTLVTISVDPVHDQPGVLSGYAAKLGADPAHWKFLTGSPEDVRALLVKGLLQSLAVAPDGTPEHTTRFVVVDGQGWMRALQDGTDPEVVQKLLIDIGSLIREGKN